MEGLLVAAIDWTDKAEAVAELVQAAAILFAGGWAYFKFARGRTFGQRADLDLSADLVACGPFLALRVAATFRNTGLAAIPFEPELPPRLSLYAVNEADWPRGKPNIVWGRRLKLTPIFALNEEVDGQEALTDEVLVALPAPADPGVAPMAYRIVCTVSAARLPAVRLWPPRVAVRRAYREPFDWTAQVVIPVGPADRTKG